MTKKSKCMNCGKEFPSQTLKKEHKKEFPDGSCPKIEDEELVGEQDKEELKTIPKIKMPKEKAKEEWRKYCEVLKTRKEKFLKVMKDAHYQMKEGRELIDIYKIMKEVGLNEKNEPKLAISRADLTSVRFTKQDTGTGTFGENGWDSTGITLPQNTFNIHWERSNPDQSWSIKQKEISTKVPLIPIELLPSGSLKNYYILWQPKEWQLLPETKDPILLKRVSENLFAILGSWDLTDLEQSVIRGL